MNDVIASKGDYKMYSEERDKSFHMPGGNHYDKMAIDIDIAFDRVGDLEKSGGVRPSRSIAKNLFCVFYNAYLRRTNRWERDIMTGMQRRWFDEFLDFWRNFLGGRPLSIVDFHALRQVYRIRSQEMDSYEWSSIDEHLARWKSDQTFSMLFHQLYNVALHPYMDLSFIKKGSRVLEYGCSHAPAYRAYREFWGHKMARWTLADIPNISFLYANYSYRADSDIDGLVKIGKDNIDNPLPDEKYDVIICNNVFEHLHAPVTIANMLIDHLSDNGLLCFDYILSEATGVDSKQGRMERPEAMKTIQNRTVLLKGNWEYERCSVGTCIVRKK